MKNKSKHVVEEAGPEDRESASKLFKKAFYLVGGAEGLETWVKEYPFDFSYVIKEKDQVVASTTIIGYDCYFRGAKIPFGGVSAVATQPTHRRKGMFRHLMEAAIPRMEKEGIVLSALHPVSVGLYEKFGYADVEQFSRHIFSPKILREVACPEGIAVKELNDPSQASKLIELFRSMKRFGSRIIPKIEDYEKLIPNEKTHFYVFEENGTVQGFMQMKFKKKDDWNITMTVERVAYLSDKVIPAMIHFMRNFDSQLEKIVWLADTHIPLLPFIAEREQLKTFVIGSMILRVIDFKTLCSLIKVPIEATKPVIIQIIDKLGPWNDGVYQLSPSEEKITLERVEEEPEVVLDTLMLSRVVGGLTTPTELHSCGMLVCSEETAKNLEAIFPKENFRAYVRF